MEIFMKSIELMIVGMGLTLAFLILMVGVMNLLKKLITALDKAFPEARPEQPAPQAAVCKAKIALAIAAAKHLAKQI
ncbi:MAG: OadG family protein [Elusimicrobiota bacterium]|jgi:sodium pump decarboxylase gamma subunit|nr:OadG family protein [Elusimicrobiota bacterium]